MRRLNDKQRAMLDELASNKSDPELWGYRKGVELFGYCGKWHTAYALERRGLVEFSRMKMSRCLHFWQARSLFKTAYGFRLL